MLGSRPHSFHHLQYTTDQETGLTSKFPKFVDDTKLRNEAQTKEDCSIIQRNLHKLMQLSLAWQRDFNLEKCRVMQFGDKNIEHECRKFGEPLLEAQEEKDLGLIFGNEKRNTESNAQIHRAKLNTYIEGKKKKEKIRRGRTSIPGTDLQNTVNCKSYRSQGKETDLPTLEIMSYSKQKRKEKR